MTFEIPGPEMTEQLPGLWKDAFGEWEGFWEGFLETAFSPDRCRCLTEDGKLLAALTWLDCRCRGQKMAYLYAVVTHPNHRGRGLCRQLLARTHEALRSQGYTAALLVPADSSLRQMYGKLGYEDATTVREFSCAASEQPQVLRLLGPEEFGKLRQRFLPEDGVLQEGENLTFLARQAQFCAGEDFLLAFYQEADSLTGLELLGNTSAAPDILRALGSKQGRFRCPGTEIPFAMWYPLTDHAPNPTWFGFAFD